MVEGGVSDYRDEVEDEEISKVIEGRKGGKGRITGDKRAGEP